MAELKTPYGLVVGLILEDKVEEKPDPVKTEASSQTSDGKRKKPASK